MPVVIKREKNKLFVVNKRCSFTIGLKYDEFFSNRIIFKIIILPCT